MSVKIEKKSDKAFSLPPIPEPTSKTVVPFLTDNPMIANTIVKYNKETMPSKHTTEQVGNVISSHPLCNVGVNAKSTINMGNYESIAIGVSINVPCEYEEIETTYLFAKNFVDTKMELLVTEVKE